MTTEEKRFFELQKRPVQGAKASQNLRLFRLIEEQTVYDEPRVKAALSPEIDDNQFAVAKSYLYNSLLKALSAYLGEQGGIKKARQQLKMVEVLFHKELIGQCEKLLKRSLELAKKYEHPLLMLEVLDWQRRIWNKRFFAGVAIADLQSHLAQVEHCLSAANTLCGLQNLHTRFMYTLRRGGFLDKTTTLKDRFSPILSDPLMQMPLGQYGFSARLPYLHTWGVYYMMCGESESALAHLERLVQDLDASPMNAYDHFEFYIAVQYNFATACIRTDRYAEAAASLRQLERLKASFTAQKAKLFVCTYLLRAEITAGTGDMDQLLAATREARDKMAQFRSQLTATERISVSITISFVLLVHGQYRDCNRVILQEMQPELVADNPDLHIAVETMRLVLYFEMREGELLESTYRSFQRFVTRNAPRFAIEGQMMQAIFQFYCDGHARPAQPFFTQLQTKYKDLVSVPDDLRPVEYFNFELWLTAKVDGISMVDALRNRSILRSASLSKS